MLPRDLQQDEEECEYGPLDPHDDADFVHGGEAPARADPLDPLANFIKQMSSMSSPDISAPVSELLSATGWQCDFIVEGISVDDAVEVFL